MAKSISYENKPLAVLRKAAGLSRNAAAVYLGIGLTTLTRYENGENDMPFGVGEKMAVLYNTLFENVRNAVRETKEITAKNKEREVS